MPGPTSRTSCGRMPSCCRPGPAGTATTRCSPTCCASSCATSRLSWCRSCTGGPPAGTGAQGLAGRGAVARWSGHRGVAAVTFEAAIAAVPAADSTHERADCLGYLALADALRGRLNRAGGTAAQASAGDGERLSAPVSPAAYVALAAVHVERNELRQAHGELKRAEAALRLHPDRLTGTVACLVAARKALAER